MWNHYPSDVKTQINCYIFSSVQKIHDDFIAYNRDDKFNF